MADHDGKGSAAIVKYAHKDCELLGYNYDQEIPYAEIEKHQEIVICDISFPMDYMFKLHAEKDLIWIDHHASAIAQYDEKLREEGGFGIKGLRAVGTAAIELTWQYFFPAQPVPEGVKLLALNDLFDLRDKRVRPFEFAFQALGVNRPYERVWRDLFEGRIDVPLMVEKATQFCLTSGTATTACRAIWRLRGRTTGSGSLPRIWRRRGRTFLSRWTISPITTLWSAFP